MIYFSLPVFLLCFIWGFFHNVLEKLFLFSAFSDSSPFKKTYKTLKILSWVKLILFSYKSHYRRLPFGNKVHLLFVFNCHSFKFWLVNRLSVLYYLFLNHSPQNLNFQTSKLCKGILKDLSMLMYHLSI